MCKPPRKEKPPRRNPGGQCKSGRWRSALDGVGAIPVLAFGRFDLATHLLSNCSREEPADRMRQPARCLHQLLHRGATRPFEEINYLLCFAPLAWAVSVRRLGFLGRFGGLFGRGRLLPRLGLGRRHTGLLCASAGLRGGFRLLGSRSGRGCFLDFRNRCRHFVCSFRGDYRGHDIHHSVGAHKQGNSAVLSRRRWDGDDPGLSVGVS